LNSLPKISVITLKNVSKIYNSTSFGLKGIDLTIEPGEFVSIVGQSGTGKTTLVKLLIAQERPTNGEMQIGGWDITNIKSHDIPFLRRQIGVIFQDFQLLSKKDVAENVSFALQVSGTPSKRIKEMVPRVLDIVGLKNKKDRYPHQLSGGEQQRVAIARALVHRPKILVADEPTGNLDTINTHEIVQILKKINQFGTTVLLVTHNREIVNQLKKRVVTLENGRIIADEVVGKYRI
jgi:cell division transport system ATP-binding protein